MAAVEAGFRSVLRTHVLEFVLLPQHLFPVTQSPGDVLLEGPFHLTSTNYHRLLHIQVDPSPHLQGLRLRQLEIEAVRGN